MATGKQKFTVRELKRELPKGGKFDDFRPIQFDSMTALEEGKPLQELPPGIGKTLLEL